MMLIKSLYVESSREIGRHSVMSGLGVVVFGSSDMTPCFQSLGTRQCVIHTLNMAVSAGVSFCVCLFSVS